MLAFPAKTTSQPPAADADGFTPPRKGRFVKAIVEKFEAFPTVQEAARPTQAAAGATGADGQAMASGNAGTGVVEIVDDEPAAEDDGPTLDALREAWEAKQRLLRDAEGKFDADDPFLATLRHYAEEAKAAFDAAKPSGPGHRRLAKVERALEKARKARDRTSTLIEQLRIDYKAKLELLQDQLDAENERVVTAQADVDDVLRGLNGGPQHVAEEGGNALCHDLLQSINAVGPTMQSVAEALRTAAPEQAEILLAAVQALDHRYQHTRAALQRQTAFFRMDDDGGDDDGGPEDDMDQGSNAMETGEPGPVAGTSPLPTGGPAGAVPGAAGAASSATARPRPDNASQPPPSKKLCDGLALAPMEGQEEASEL